MDTLVTKSQVFLSYAREDREEVEKLYQHLSTAGFKPWMDTMDILPGEVWMESIRSAIEKSDFFLVCLSSRSINKRGILQKEFKSALDVWQGMFESDIYLIPVRLEECAVPVSMAKFQWVDIYKKDGFERLEKAMREGIERRNTGVTPLIEKPQLPESPDIQTENPRRTSLRPSRRSIVPRWGGIVAILAAILFLPLIINNYLYKVKRPVLPAATCQVSEEPVRLGLSRLEGCLPVFQEQLAASWMGETVVTSIIPQAFVSSDQARRNKDYDIVVWGACDTSEPDVPSLTFELITSRKPYSVYEPIHLQFRGNLNEINDLGTALIAYQHGNYTEAVTGFDSLPTASRSTAYALFRSNSLLYAERYDEAIASYQAISGAKDLNAAAAFNNMGVAYFNQDVNLGLDQFNQSVQLANQQGAMDIEALALGNRSLFYRLKSQWTDSLDDCSAMLKLNGKSALPYLCFAGYNFLYYRFQPPGLLPLKEINRNLTEAEKYQDVPAEADYMRGNWNLSHFWKRKQEAVDAYSAYLDEMQYRACMRNDHESISNAEEQITKISQP